MEFLNILVQIRGFLLLILFFVGIVLCCVFRKSKKKNAVVKKITIVLGIFIVVLSLIDIIKTNCIFWERNITNDTVNLLVESIEDDRNLFYENMERMDGVTVIGPEDFYEEYFDSSAVVYDRKIPVELLYEDGTIKIYQSKVWYNGTNLFIPIEPFYYACSIYVVYGDEVTEISFSKDTLLFFNIDKMIQEGNTDNQGTVL